MSQLLAGVIGFLLLLGEGTWLHYAELASITPNLTLIFVVLWGLLKGSRRGRYLGLALGLLQDFLFCRYIGFYGMVYYLLGHSSGYFQKDFYQSHAILPLLIVAGADLIYGFLQYLVYCFFAGDLAIVYYLLHRILPEMCYTAMISVILYPLVCWLSRMTEKIDSNMSKLRKVGKRE